MQVREQFEQGRVGHLEWVHSGQEQGRAGERGLQGQLVQVQELLGQLGHIEVGEGQRRTGDHGQQRQREQLDVELRTVHCLEPTPRN